VVLEHDPVTLAIELGRASTLDPCPCCGARTRIVRGFVTRDGCAHAVYLVRWSVGNPAHDASIAVSIGEWAGETADRRVCFVLAHRIVNGGPTFMNVDGASSAWSAEAAFLGRMLSRDEALERAERQDVYDVLDAAGLHDERLRGWWLE
jgi:hypothetical protein